VINTLDPAQAALIPEFYVIWALYNALLKFDADMKPVLDLAESFKMEDDGGLTFKLRPGVKFHDGSVLTSDDVRFTFERLLDDKNHSPNKDKVSAISAIDTPDPLTVRIHTKQPFAPLLTFLANARTGTQIVPRKVVEADPSGFGRKPVGTGAFKLTEWTPNQGLRFAAHRAYFVQGLPKLGTVVTPLIAEETSGVTALLGHQVDLTSTAPFADIPELMERKEIRVLRQPGLNTRFISLNNRRSPFDDLHFRRAVSLAFDRNVLVRVVLFGEGVAQSGLIPPLSQSVLRSSAATADDLQPAAGQGGIGPVEIWRGHRSRDVDLGFGLVEADRRGYHRAGEPDDRHQAEGRGERGRHRVRAVEIGRLSMLGLGLARHDRPG
jgi:peptide/nickel transport system substrate-binding protein